MDVYVVISSSVLAAFSKLSVWLVASILIVVIVIASPELSILSRLQDVLQRKKQKDIVRAYVSGNFQKIVSYMEKRSRKSCYDIMESYEFFVRPETVLPDRTISAQDVVDTNLALLKYKLAKYGFSTGWDEIARELSGSCETSYYIICNPYLKFCNLPDELLEAIYKNDSLMKDKELGECCSAFKKIVSSMAERDNETAKRILTKITEEETC